MARISAPHDVDWDRYYSAAEDHAEAAWNLIYNRIRDLDHLDMTAVVDFACGKGRIAQVLFEICPGAHTLRHEP